MELPDPEGPCSQAETSEVNRVVPLPQVALLVSGLASKERMDNRERRTDGKSAFAIDLSGVPPVHFRRIDRARLSNIAAVWAYGRSARPVGSSQTPVDTIGGPDV